MFAATNLKVWDVGYSNTGDGMVGNAARDFMNSMDKVCALMKDKLVAADIKYVGERMNLINSVRASPASLTRAYILRYEVLILACMPKLSCLIS